MEVVMRGRIAFRLMVWAATAGLAAAGRAIYQATCASCHLPDMRGSNEASPLAGSNFLNTWRNRAVSQLFNKIKDTMPVSNPGSLGEQDALNLVAYILETNGAPAGTQALTPAAAALIG